MIEEKVLNQWSLKEIVAHLSAWNWVQAKAVDELLANKKPAWWGQDEKAFNQAAVEQRQGMSFEALVKEWELSFQELMKKLESLSDAEWIQEAGKPDADGIRLNIDAMLSYQYRGEDHEGGHAKQIKEFLEKNEGSKLKVPDIHKAGGILIQNRKILVERSHGREVFLAPGGRIEPGETSDVALIRELKEEFGIVVRADQLKSFGTFTAAAVGEPGKTIHMDVFLLSGWSGELKATSEVDEIAWIDTKFDANMKLGSIIEYEILPRLHAEGVID